jgi:ribosomal protein L22
MEAIQNIDSNSVSMEETVVEASDNSSRSGEDIQTNENRIDSYLSSYIHALTCIETKCEHEKCVQFKRAIQHSKQCQKYQKCNFCYQLIALSCYHSKQCNDKNCLVPFCISIKMKLNSIIEMKRIKKFLVENSDFSKMYGRPELSDAAISCKRKRTCDDLASTNIDKALNFENEQHKKHAEFLAKIKAIKEKASTPQRTNKLLNKVLPNQRKELINFLFELTLQTNLPIDQDKCHKNIDFKNVNLARYALYLIRKEEEINDNLEKEDSSDDYLYLLAELAFKAKFEMEKFLANEKVNSESQCDILNEEELVTAKKIKLE